MSARSKRGSGSRKPVSGSQVPLRIGNQSLLFDPSDRSPKVTETLVPTESATYDRTTPLALVLLPPLRGRTSAEELGNREFKRRAATPRRRFDGDDVLELRAAQWLSLPLRATLCCQLDSSRVRCCVTSSRAVWQALRRLRRAVFGTREWLALVSSFESDRSSPYDLCKWVENKLANAWWRVTERDALGRLPSSSVVATGDARVGDVLAGWGLELERVVYGAELPPRECR